MSNLLQRANETAFAFGEDIENSPDGTIYVADLRTSEIFCFSGSAAVIWCLLDDAITKEKLIELVAETFGEEPSTIRAETLNFVDGLISQNLLERS